MLSAAGPDVPEADRALTTLCETYWYPLYAYLRRHGHDADAAQDLIQSFFARLLDRGRHVLRQADPARGRFRSFLLTSLKHFVINEYQRDRALRRGGGVDVLSLDFVTAEGRYRLDPGHDDTPDRAFDRTWALLLLERTVTRLRDRAERPDQFELLKVYLLGEHPIESYADTAARLDMSEGAVRVAVHRLRRRFRDLLRDEIDQTVTTPQEAEDESRHLRAAVARQ